MGQHNNKLSNNDIIAAKRRTVLELQPVTHTCPTSRPNVLPKTDDATHVSILDANYPAIQIAAHYQDE